MAIRRLAVDTYGGKIRVSPSFEIAYECSGENPCCIWLPSPTFALTLFKSPSGSGKTTFLSQLFERLNGSARSDALRFDFSPDFDDPEAGSVAMIPQNPPMVNHWKLQEILPAKSHFLKSFFPIQGNDGPVFWKKRIGEFSGGQRRKLYTCSALERLASLRREYSFLLLDETFDGLGAVEARRCLSAIQTGWAEVAESPLYLLLVTHLNTAEILDGGVTATTMGLTVNANPDDHLAVTLASQSC